MTTIEFAQKIRAKYPEYRTISDEDLVEKVLEKYPEYRTQITDLVRIPHTPEVVGNDGRSLEERHQSPLTRQGPTVGVSNYDGYIGEHIKRVQKRQLVKTREVDLTLIGQERAAHEEALKIRRLQGEMSRVDNEDVLAELRLEVEKESLLTQIAGHRKERQKLNKPPSSGRKNPRNITVEPDDDAD